MPCSSPLFLAGVNTLRLVHTELLASDSCEVGACAWGTCCGCGILTGVKGNQVIRCLQPCWRIVMGERKRLSFDTSPTEVQYERLLPAGDVPCGRSVGSTEFYCIRGTPRLKFSLPHWRRSAPELRTALQLVQQPKEAKKLCKASL